MTKKKLFPMKKLYIRSKPSLKIKKTKNGIEIVKTLYDNFGKVVQKQVESISK